MIFLILARNESNSLDRGLQAVKAQLREDDQLHVVADHCHDHTAEIARSYGATVHVRHDNGPTGKAAALRWWVERQHFDPSQPVVILDADSVILPGFTNNIYAAMQSGAAGAQAALIAESEDETQIGRLIGLSERMEQGFFDRFRSRIGGSVRLRGTGMALQFGLLQKYAPMLQTKTEDIELALLLAKDRIKIIPAFDALLIDPKPHVPEGAMNQRARWLQGQVEILRRYPSVILSLLFSNPLGFSLVGSALIKPRSFFSGLRWFVSGAAFVSILLSSSPADLIYAVLTLSLVLNLLELIALSHTLWTSPNRKKDLIALGALPAFLYLWIRSVTHARLSRSHWLRARPIQVPSSLNETATASN
jgi:cellulose synthase/poly-beta-1,6-N-acetylglucosamine synthase-like glycosyltransferase